MSTEIARSSAGRAAHQPAPGTAAPAAPDTPTRTTTDIDVRRDGSERVRYDPAGRYSYVRRGRLRDFPRMRAACHWHDDLEFIRILAGSMTYYVDGATVAVSPGHGLFVNSRRLHFGYSPDGTDCLFICVLFHPLRLGALSDTVSAFIRPLTADATFPFALLRPDRPDEGAVLADLDDLDAAVGSDTEPLTRLSRCVDLVDHLTSIAHARAATTQGRSPSSLRSRPSSEDRGLAALGAMVDLVHREHARDLRVEDIARAGAVGRTSCAEIFQRHLRQSPVDFLIDVRLQTACGLLRDTDLPIARVAAQVGFHSPAHFTRTFHARIGSTPLAFRRDR